MTILGSAFLSGATVRIGGAAASSVSVTGSTQIVAKLPALSPGTLNDVVVTNPGGAAAAKPKAFFADFATFPAGSMLQSSVEKLVRAAVTSGCGAGNFCPDSTLTRAEAAKFLLRSKHGPSYVPPPAKGTVFLDVPKTDPFAGWIEQLSAEGISGGCGDGKFCGASTLNRASLAVLLLKTIHGGTYRPPAADRPLLGRAYVEHLRRLDRAALPGGDHVGVWSLRVLSGRLASRGEMALFLAGASTYRSSPRHLPGALWPLFGLSKRLNSLPWRRKLG